MFWAKTKETVEYQVKVDGYEAGEYDLVFNNREAARLYKKALKNSTRQLQARIVRREYDGAYISDEKEVY